MPEFNAKCDVCRITFRAYVYGWRAKRVATCPQCGEQVRGFRKRPEGYSRLVYRGQSRGTGMWELTGAPELPGLEVEA